MSERIDPNYFGGIRSPRASVLRRTWLKQPAPSTKIDTTTLRTDLEAYLRGIWGRVSSKTRAIYPSGAIPRLQLPLFSGSRPFGEPLDTGEYRYDIDFLLDNVPSMDVTP